MGGATAGPEAGAYSLPNNPTSMALAWRCRPSELTTLPFNSCSGQWTVLVVSLANGYDVCVLEVLAGGCGAPHATACVPVRPTQAMPMHAGHEMRTRFICSTWTPFSRRLGHGQSVRRRIWPWAAAALAQRTAEEES